MFPALVGALYVPVAAWLALAVGLMVAFRRSTPPVVLRLAVGFLAVWALIATTAAAWVLTHGGWSAVVALLQSPGRMFAPGGWPMWIVGGVGAFGVFAVAFGLNQIVGRGFLRLLGPRPLPWPRSLPRPDVSTTLMLFDSPAPEAFSFALVRRRRLAPPGPPTRYILLSTGLRARLAPDEMEAAVAHELGHLRGLDGRYLTFLRTLARMMRWDPIIGYLTSCLTRREEFRADAEAARAHRAANGLGPRALQSLLRAPRDPRSVGNAGVPGRPWTTRPIRHGGPDPSPGGALRIGDVPGGSPWAGLTVPRGPGSPPRWLPSSFCSSCSCRSRPPGRRTRCSRSSTAATR